MSVSLRGSYDNPVSPARVAYDKCYTLPKLNTPKVTLFVCALVAPRVAGQSLKCSGFQQILHENCFHFDAAVLFEILQTRFTTTSQTFRRAVREFLTFFTDNPTCDSQINVNNVHAFQL